MRMMRVAAVLVQVYTKIHQAASVLLNLTLVLFNLQVCVALDSTWTKCASTTCIN